MKTNQIIAIVSCAALCIVVYLFTSTKKQDDTPKPVAVKKEQPAAPDRLDIEAYIDDINSRIEDKNTRDKVENFLQTKSYRELVDLYVKMDKPLAVAWFSVLLAEKSGTPKDFMQAGDYNSVLLQSAPDIKARDFLSQNAISSYEQAVKLDSTNTEYKLRLAAAYMEIVNQPMKGVPILLDIVEKDPNNIDALLLLGRGGILSGQYDKAIGRLEKVIYLSPQNSEALLLLAEAYSGKGNRQKALELLERCKKTVTNPELKKEIEKYIESIKKPAK